MTLASILQVDGLKIYVMYRRFYYGLMSKHVCSFDIKVVASAVHNCVLYT